MSTASTTAAAVPVTPGGHDVGHWAAWRRAARRLDLPQLTEGMGLDVDTAPRLVVVAAHPDDETLGLGRLIHRWGRTVGPVTAVVATAGEACFDHIGPRPDGLAERRLVEWRNAADVLGVAQTYALGLPDGSLADGESALAEALSSTLALLSTGANSDRATSAGGGPTIDAHEQVVLACPWRGDPHPDHRAVGRVVGDLAARRQLPLLEFGVWMTYWSEPTDLAADGRELAVLVADGADEEAHRRACAAFATQLEPFAPGLGPVVPPEMLAHHGEQLLVLPVRPT